MYREHLYTSPVGIGGGDFRVREAWPCDSCWGFQCSLRGVGRAKGGGRIKCSATHTTTVDYVLMDLAAASMMESCETLSKVELNLSDHLPLSVTLGCDPSCSIEQKAQFDGVDWQNARARGALADYEKEVRERMGAFQHGDDDRSQIKAVAELLVGAAKKTLPQLGSESHRKKWFSDDILRSLCAQSREACKGWREAGCPREGALFERRVSAKRAVRRRVRECAAREERKRIQRREKLFRSGAPGRFRIPEKKRKCSKLVSDGHVVNDRGRMLELWVEHFEGLARSRLSEDKGRSEYSKELDKLEAASRGSAFWTSVIAKLLEMLVLSRMSVLLSEAGIPHVNQSAYRKGVSCSDAIFATQEAIARYVGGGSKVYMCLYDLQKAFDLVEYPVLFRRWG